MSPRNGTRGKGGSDPRNGSRTRNGMPLVGFAQGKRTQAQFGEEEGVDSAKNDVEGADDLHSLSPEQLRELFGSDAQKMLKEGKISRLQCIANGCKNTFFIPYGRHHIEGGSVNRGTCNSECETAYKEQLKEASLAEEMRFLKEFGLA